MAGSSDQYEFPWDDEQAEHKERVFSRIARSIVDFCAEHKTFHADDLRQHVVAETGVAAPGSADRILRDLRQRKLLDYIVLDRRASLYEVLWVAKVSPLVEGK